MSNRIKGKKTEKLKYETLSIYSGSIMRYHINMPEAGFNPPLVDDTPYEADALPTKPPRLDVERV